MNIQKDNIKQIIKQNFPSIILEILEQVNKEIEEIAKLRNIKFLKNQRQS